VHVDVVEPRDLGLDVARHREVDDEHRLAPARLDGRSIMPRPMIAASWPCTDDDVEMRDRVRQFGQLDGVAWKRWPVPAPLLSAVGHGDRLGMLRGECVAVSSIISPRDEQDILAAEVAEMRCATRTRRRHRHRLRADLRRGPHFLRHGEGTLEQMVQHQAEAPRCGRVFRPASSGRGSAARRAHRIEPARHAERMAHRARCGST